MYCVYLLDHIFFQIRNHITGQMQDIWIPDRYILHHKYKDPARAFGWADRDELRHKVLIVFVDRGTPLPSLPLSQAILLATATAKEFTKKQEEQDESISKSVTIPPAGVGPHVGKE
jgi:hypothetical protein